MDPIVSPGLIYGILAIVITGGLLFMTRPASLTSPTSLSYGTYIPNLSTFQRWGRIAGILIPFALIAIGPLVDLYKNSFHYTSISLIGIVGMILGYGYQTIVRGSTAYLSSLTIGTSAVLTYLLYDVWVNSDGYTFKVLSTVLGAILMFLQLLHTVSGPVFSTSLLNDGVGVLLGSGIGAISWVIVYNFYREYLPNQQGPTKDTKK